MSKKGDIIARFMEEKGVTEYNIEENFNFKEPEWVEKKREHSKRAGPVGKHTKNLKQITTNDPHGD